MQWIEDGLDLLSTFLGSSMWKCKQSPMEIFHDDEKFKRTIKKCWKWCVKTYR